jgi:hypothetical protein
MTATITVTGLDERTPVQALLNLARMPNVELGFLYTRTPEGRNRYPSREWLARALPRATGRAALHVCGGGARRELVAGEMGELLPHVQRIQVNGLLQVEDVEQICAAYPGHTIITQHKPDNAHLLSVQAPNHALLVDGSGGRGLAPETWVHPDSTKPVGFAGGLGPDSIATELTRVKAVAEGAWWVDMEGKLRTEDWFDAHLAARAILVFNEAMGLVKGVATLDQEDLAWVVAQAVAAKVEAPSGQRTLPSAKGTDLIKFALLAHLRQGR